MIEMNLKELKRSKLLNKSLFSISTRFPFFPFPSALLSFDTLNQFQFGSSFLNRSKTSDEFLLRLKLFHLFFFYPSRKRSKNKPARKKYKTCLKLTLVHRMPET